ncbi:hypothetical protein ABQE69_03635 [Mycolicibacillus trivialis]|uniref:Class I SAM-dependent methyltransferase n=1 Tax=Mycolicibacillus trivialis TaxID=1798 RepID=A0A1X2EFG1_9MYCO|nr:hypothetical protein [Mycolicibacillus trivialis]ORW98913.1 hypothetical protein AWC30_01140 [Mycolicibacillus trivialis]
MKTTTVRPTPARPAVSASPAITCRAVEVSDGLTVEYVSVPDLSDAPRHRADRSATQREITAIDRALRSRPDLPAPDVGERAGDQVLRPNNPVAAALYRDRPALRAWRTDLVPSAMALTPLYRPEEPRLPNGAPIDRATRDIFLYAPDAIAIRSRAAIMSAIAGRYLSPTTATRWTSLACGAAIPVFQALAGRRCRQVELTLVDLDAGALAHAAELGAAAGVGGEVDTRLLQRHLIREMIVSDRLVDEVGEASQDLVDMLGIFEYIPAEFGELKSASVFLRNAFRLLKPGGAVVAANMLDTHPRLAFNQRGIGWPRIFPRSIAELREILHDAGIPPEQVTMTLAADGVYAVLEIRKPSGAS